jgi:Spy/CpxP family protein refolding chaperone
MLAAAVSLSAGDEKWTKLKAELNLSDAQVTQLQEKFKQLDPLYQKAMTLKEELKALETAATPDNRAIEAKKANLVALKLEWKAKADAIYKSVLTRDQFTKLEEMEAKYQKEQTAKKQ